MIKKLFLTLTMISALLFFAGCDDGSSDSSSGVSLSPPSWIQGSWEGTDSYGDTYTYTFTSNSVSWDGDDLANIATTYEVSFTDSTGTTTDGYNTYSISGTDSYGTYTEVYTETSDSNIITCFNEDETFDLNKQ
ncbi:MAG: hypothetical protein PQJ59_14785 [Spirochaetales bacterium]|nr:hypothetical protein [Spirochaetales bacterium]